MNEFVALFRKDLRRLAIPLSLWAASGLYLAIVQVIGAPPSSGRDHMQVLSLMLFVALGVVIIGWAVQDDNPRSPGAFWRSRPIPPQLLVGAKLTFLAVMLVALPALVIVLGEQLFPGFFRRLDRLHQVMGFACCLVTACAALAACTRNIGEYILGGVLAVVLTKNLGAFLETLSPIDASVSLRLMGSQFFVAMILCGFGGLIALVLQYRFNRLRLTLSVIAVTLLLVALADAFWAWRIL
jgi:hypothetical protein